MSTCTDCGEEGPHFVPPSLGEPGFFICDGDKVLISGEPPDPNAEAQGYFELIEAIGKAFGAKTVYELHPTPEHHIYPVPSRGERYGKSDGRILPKLPGRKRNQTCPGCGRKMKRCACSPTPSEQATAKPEGR